MTSPSIGRLWVQGVNFSHQATRFPSPFTRVKETIEELASYFFRQACIRGTFENYITITFAGCLVCATVASKSPAGPIFVGGTFLFFSLLSVILEIAQSVFGDRNESIFDFNNREIRVSAGFELPSFEEGAKKALERIKKTDSYKHLEQKHLPHILLFKKDPELLADLKKGICYGKTIVFLRNMPTLYSVDSKKWPALLQDAKHLEESCYYQLLHRLRVEFHNEALGLQRENARLIAEKKNANSTTEKLNHLVQLVLNSYRSEVDFDGVLGVSGRELVASSAKELEEEFPKWMSEDFISPNDLTPRNLPQEIKSPAEMFVRKVFGTIDWFFGWGKKAPIKIDHAPDPNRIFAGKISVPGHSMFYQCSNGVYRIYDQNFGWYDAKNFSAFCKLMFTETKTYRKYNESVRLSCFAIQPK